MEFLPLHFKEQIRIINPQGRVALITLWSKPDWILEKMKEAKIDISPYTSLISGVGTLYGNGLPELLRNLLYNPQIDHIIIMGKNRSGSAEDLENFFISGLEETNFLGQKRYKIKKRSRIIDNAVTPEDFPNPPRRIYLGEAEEESLTRLKNILKEIEQTPQETGETSRVEIPIPRPENRMFPSNRRNHNILAQEPLAAWKEILFRIVRFGQKCQLKKGERLEIQNLKAVVENPAFIEEDLLKKHGLDPGDPMDYYKNFLKTEKPRDTAYTYGNRLGEYFGLNTVGEAAEKLRRDPENRSCYISLWDTPKDLPSPTGHPCLVTVFLRKFDDALTVTATFRTHNAMDGWLRNFYGIMRIQDEVMKKAGLKRGAITIISHSISIDMKRFEVAKCVADEKKFSLSEDPNGYFNITLENGEIVARHFCQGSQIDEYRGAKASRLQHEIHRNCALSDINHALYLGRMLERAQRCLEDKKEFIQE